MGWQAVSFAYAVRALCQSVDLFWASVAGPDRILGYLSRVRWTFFRHFLTQSYAGFVALASMLDFGIWQRDI